MVMLRNSMRPPCGGKWRARPPIVEPYYFSTMAAPISQGVAVFSGRDRHRDRRMPREATALRQNRSMLHWSNTTRSVRSSRFGSSQRRAGQIEKPVHQAADGARAGAVAEVVELDGGVISGLFNEP